MKFYCRSRDGLASSAAERGPAPAPTTAAVGLTERVRMWVVQTTTRHYLFGTLTCG